MRGLKVEKELLEEFKLLLGIPLTRKYLEHAREVCKIEFADVIMEYLEGGKNREKDPGSGRDRNRHTGEKDLDFLRTAASTEFDFHLRYSRGEWQPFIDLGDSGFEVEDMLPEKMRESITAHMYAQYHWYYLEDREFKTRNYGEREFYVAFKYIAEDFIAGTVRIFLGEALEVVPSFPVASAYKGDNIIHMNKNRHQFFEMLEDREAWEFLHYFFTFPFLRRAVLEEFKHKLKPFLVEKFDDIIQKGVGDPNPLRTSRQS